MYTYPAIFEKDGDGYFVNFPDLEGCYTPVSYTHLTLPTSDLV